MKSNQPVAPSEKPIPMSLILIAALVVHLPLLMMELPLKSYDAYFHIFFASHYLHHWFNPWNSKWYAGFSQTTYPPLPQQWIAVLSRITGLEMGYMVVQLAAILLLVVGVYRFSLLWVSPRAASLAALASVFLGAESFLVYSAGQLGTTSAAPLYLNALPYMFDWVRHGRWRSFLKATRSVRRRRRCPPRHAAVRLLPFCRPSSRAGPAGPSRRGTNFRTGLCASHCLDDRGCGRCDYRRAASVLDCTDPLSGDAGSHSPSQPGQLHSESAVGHELLHRSLWGDDSGAAVHRDPGLRGGAASSLAPGLLGGISVRTRRYYSGRACASGSGL